MARFPHRHNPDGSYDSICSRCFAIVGSIKTEEELYVLERLHVCDPDLLYDVTSARRPKYKITI
jgi:hypothetical protein